jgi:hypothetical protein
VRFLAAGALILLTIGLVGAGATPPTPWLGVWIGNDPAPPGGDGSNLKLIFKPSGAVTLIDDDAMICDGGPAVAKGTGVPSDGTNVVSYMSIVCSSGVSPEGLPIEVTYTVNGTALDGTDDSEFARP